MLEEKLERDKRREMVTGIRLRREDVFEEKK